MLVKVIEIQKLSSAGPPRECGSWRKDSGYYDETKAVQCVEKATFETLYRHYGEDHKMRKTSSRYWCHRCLPDEYKPFMEILSK